jgi:chromosome segregation ATPase
MSTSRELDETKDQKLALETENADLINQINDLNANRAQLEADIASKQTELEQANVALQGTKRCVALFDNVRGQLNSYNANLEKSGALVLEAIDASINGDEALANAKIDEAVRFSNAAQANLNNINGTLNRIKTGSCQVFVT